MEYQKYIFMDVPAFSGLPQKWLNSQRIKGCHRHSGGQWTHPYGICFIQHQIHLTFSIHMSFVETNYHMLWIFPTIETSSLCIIIFILTMLNIKQHPWKIIIGNEYGLLSNWIDPIDILLETFNIPMDTTYRYASWINVKYERHHGSIHNVVRSTLISINHIEDKFCCSMETTVEVCCYKIHIALNNIPSRFSWYGTRHSIDKLKYFG